MNLSLRRPSREYIRLDSNSLKIITLGSLSPKWNNKDKMKANNWVSYLRNMS